MDVELVADMRIEQADTLAQMLGDDFYTDVEMISNAIIHQHSFNVIHQETMFKVDVFLRKPRPFDQAQFERRRKYVLAEDPERAAYFATPGDNMLAKLEWYRLGGEVSDRQWGDVLNVLKIQGERLDRAYLREWAAELSVVDLLEKAFQEAQ